MDVIFITAVFTKRNSGGVMECFSETFEPLRTLCKKRSPKVFLGVKSGRPSSKDAHKNCRQADFLALFAIN